MSGREITAAPFASQLYLMAKPAGAACNLACGYCYYLDKKAQSTPSPKMTDRVLESFIREYIGASTTREVLFTWHGGEPLLQSRSFYRRALELQRRYAGGRRIDNCIQTNGTLIDDDWARFFADNGFLVGLSIDGPRQVHDRYRRGRNGAPSHARAEAGARLLTRHGVEWNAMATVNAANAGDPEGFYTYFRDTLGARYLQFAPVVERIDGAGRIAAPATSDAPVAPFSVTPAQWGSFLCGLFDIWVRRDVGEMFVQLFDATLANYVGVAPGVCTLGPTCGHAAVMEHNGDVYCCDHYVFPQYRLGNITTHTVAEMAMDPRLGAFGRAKRDSLPPECRSCRWLFACNGECPKNRIVASPTGAPGMNYLCSGYRAYFDHTEAAFRFMAGELAAGRAPANIMKEMQNNS